MATRAQIEAYIANQITDALNRQNTAEVVRAVLNYLALHCFNKDEDEITPGMVAGLAEALALKADLVNGKVPAEQLPAFATFWGTMARAADNAQTVDEAIQVAVDNLVNASPEQLNTLNELAAALANDPNFASTITAQLALKIDATEKGAANGVATLDAAGLVTESQLPPYPAVHTDDYSTYAPLEAGEIEATDILPGQRADGVKFKWTLGRLKAWLYSVLSFVKTVNGYAPDATGNVILPVGNAGADNGISWLVAPILQFVEATNTADVVNAEDKRPVAEWVDGNIVFPQYTVSPGGVPYVFPNASAGMQCAYAVVGNGNGLYEVIAGAEGAKAVLPGIPGDRLLAAFVIMGDAGNLQVVFPGSGVQSVQVVRNGVSGDKQTGDIVIEIDEVDAEQLALDLSNKADLVNGKVPAEQLPAQQDVNIDFSSYAALSAGEADTDILPGQRANGTKFKWTLARLKAYLFAALAFVKTVNGVAPDAAGNVVVSGGSSETGATIRDKLQALIGAARLDFSAIKNAPSGMSIPNTRTQITALNTLNYAQSRVQYWVLASNMSISVINNPIVGEAIVLQIDGRGTAYSFSMAVPGRDGLNEPPLNGTAFAVGKYNSVYLVCVQNDAGGVFYEYSYSSRV